MANLNPEKLTVQFTPVDPRKSAAAPRRYTGSHTRGNGKVMLTVGPEYGISARPHTDSRDRLLFAEWRDDEMGAALHVYLDDMGQQQSDDVRLFIQAVRYGDRHLFSAYPDLDHAPVIVHTNSRTIVRHPAQWGAMKDYILPHLHSQAGFPQWASPTWVSLSQQYDPI